ncbi:MAG TPA: I78 family peptidase inhibitor [Caulobacteraceae bacterium]|nr:I78 family peptidase inhibitor [Caulobacteraceae bacterium]
MAALIVACACAEPAKAPLPAAAPTIQPPPPRSRPPPAAAPASHDACHAAPLQYLVGKPHTDIPVPVIPALRRVVCSTCVMTRDYNPARQTIIYDSTNGLVTSVKCG